MPTNIRYLRPDEWPNLKALRLEALASDPSAFFATHAETAQQPDEYWQERIRRSLDAQFNRFTLVTEIDGTLVGMVNAYSLDETSWMIAAMYVRSNVRGQGIARRLLEATLDELRRHGTKRAVLLVNVSQTAAVALYSRLGFTILETLRYQMMGDGNRYDEHRMAKHLE